MSRDKKWTVLVIKDKESLFDMGSKSWSELFKSVDFSQGREETLKFFDTKSYDVVIGDLSVNPNELGLLKQLQDKKAKQCIFAFVAPKDTDKLYGIADLGINAFELTADQLNQALETIAQFDPYEVQG